MTFTDTHCHLDNPRFANDREASIERALEAGVTKMGAIGTGEGPPDLEVAIRLAEKYPCFVATVGVHPHHAALATGETWKRMEELLRHPLVPICGEIGLDYHYNFSPPEVQRDVFAEQLRIARDADKPVAIHTREAWDDTFQILEKHWTGGRGIMHCFSGGPAEAERSLALGFHLSFAGVLTFPKADALREAARLAPADRILVETDAPYLAPVPHRGKRNEPAFVLHTIRKLAEIRGVSEEEIARQTSENFERLCRKSK